MPDLDPVTANGALRVFALLHDARPVLLNLGEPGGFDITLSADRVQSIDAKNVGTWMLPERPGGGVVTIDQQPAEFARNQLPRTAKPHSAMVGVEGFYPRPGTCKSATWAPGNNRVKMQLGRRGSWTSTRTRFFHVLCKT